jgi:hypothetical protein
MLPVAAGELETAEKATVPDVKGTAAEQVVREVCNGIWSAHACKPDGSRK